MITQDRIITPFWQDVEMYVGVHASQAASVPVNTERLWKFHIREQQTNKLTNKQPTNQMCLLDFHPTVFK